MHCALPKILSVILIDKNIFCLLQVPLPRIDMPGKYLATRVSIRENHTEIPKGKYFCVAISQNLPTKIFDITQRPWEVLLKWTQLHLES